MPSGEAEENYYVYRSFFTGRKDRLGHGRFAGDRSHDLKGPCQRGSERAAWDKVLGLNVKGVFNLSVACLPLLEAAAVDRDPARIINVGSIEGFRTAPGENYAYSASKAAVHNLTLNLAQRLARNNITVNAIAPGPFHTKMMSAILSEKGDEFRANCPMGRLGEPDDMAGIAVYLASRASSYVTGQIIAVDGGFSTTPW